MSLQVIITREAAGEIQAKYRWLAKRSKVSANRWRDLLLQAIVSLKDKPERYPEAPEAVAVPSVGGGVKTTDAISVSI